MEFTNKYTEIESWFGYEKEKMLNLLKNKFTENVDYVHLDDLYLTDTTVKKISMTLDNENGDKIRQYYIDLESLNSENNDNNNDNNIENPLTIFKYGIDNTIKKVEFDIQDFKNKEVLYLLHIKDDIYKFGVTQNIVKRLSNHKTYYNYNYVIKCWECINRTVSKQIEDAIILYAHHARISHQINKDKELIKTTNIQEFIKNIDNYVEKHIAKYKQQFRDAILEQQIEYAKIMLEVTKNLSNILSPEKKELLKSINNSGAFTSILTMNIDEKQYQDTIVNNTQILEQNTNSIDDEDNDDYEENDIEKMNNKISAMRKCQRCKRPYTEEDFGINPTNNTPYMNCKICRDRQILSDQKRTPEQIEKKREATRIYAHKHKEEIKNKKQEKSIDIDIYDEEDSDIIDEVQHEETNEAINNEIIQEAKYKTKNDNNNQQNTEEQNQKCSRCYKKLPLSSFGLNKDNQPYKNCTVCREKIKQNDAQRSKDPIRLAKKKEYNDKMKQEKIQAQQKNTNIINNTSHDNDTDIDIESNNESDIDIDTDNNTSHNKSNTEPNIEPISDQTQKCSRCDKKLPLADFGLNKDNQPYKNCIICREKGRIKDAKRRDNPEVMAKRKEYNDRTREERAIKRREEYAALPEDEKEKLREQKREYIRQQRELNPDKFKQTEEQKLKQKQRYEEKHDQILQQKKDYYNTNKEIIRAKQKEYYDQNSSEIINHKRYAHTTKQSN